MKENEHMQMLFEVFVPSLPRLGPGDDESTKKALQTLYAAGLPDDRPLKILDLGCGNGAPTMALAENTRGTILALDFHQPFLSWAFFSASASFLILNAESLTTPYKTPQPVSSRTASPSSATLNISSTS